MKHLCYELGYSKEEMYELLERQRKLVYVRKMLIGKKLRDIHIVSDRYTSFLLKLHKLLSSLPVSPIQHGCVKGRSTDSNAAVHIGNEFLYKFDISNCFPSITRNRVFHLFYDRLSCSPKVSNFLADISTFEGRLPQGFNTSPSIANLVLVPLANRIHGLAKKYGGGAGVFVDDIGVSLGYSCSKIKNKVITIIEEEGFLANPDKIEELGPGSEKVITGRRANDHVDAKSADFQDVRRRIKRLPVQQFENYDHYQKYIRSLRGKISYIGQVNRGAAKMYASMLNKTIAASRN